MIKSIRLKFGRSPHLNPEPITPAAVTVFIGPNNAGKSKILSEINQYCRTGQKNTSYLILENLEFDAISEEEIQNVLEKYTLPPVPGEVVGTNQLIFGSHLSRVQVSRQQLIDCMKHPNGREAQFCPWIFNHMIIMLNGKNRLTIRAQAAGDLQQPPQSSFQVLFRDDLKRQEVRNILYKAFGSYFVLDPTNIGQLRPRLSPRAPKTHLEERGLHHEAVEFHKQAQSIEESSDGVKAFTAIITELIAGDPKVLLIDEPEAFLHPSLITQLASEISRMALREKKQVFVSTHHQAFLMGCIQSGAPVNIIRLTYRFGSATARILPNEQLLELMRNPLLRSAGVLNALFYEFVVVTESDADRAFYQEINERLLQFKPEWGIPNCLFINAQNKQTIPTILQPLRQLGIPAAGIFDIDVLKDGGLCWTKILASAGVPEISHQSFATMRASVKKAMDSTGKEMKREGGINILPTSEQKGAKDLLTQLNEYGIFVVPRGEVESWLPSLKITGHGPDWLVAMFTAMGSNPQEKGFLKPSNDDVWEFISQIQKWLTNLERKGIPE